MREGANEWSAPGSPVARRTKHEIRSSQKNAKKYVEKPKLWPLYLLSTIYRCDSESVFYLSVLLLKLKNGNEIK